MLRVPHDTIWVRDYGPLFSLDAGRRTAVDARYPPLGRPLDDRAPAGLATYLGDRLRTVSAALEGGNLLSNGRGLLVATDKLVHDNRAVGRSWATVVSQLRASL